MNPLGKKNFLFLIKEGLNIVYSKKILKLSVFLLLNDDYLIFQKNPREKVNVGIRQPYFRVVGIHVETEGASGSTTQSTISPSEEEDLRRLAATPNIYETLAKSIAPSIYGSLDIKKAIACLLFGGSRKR